MNSFDLSEEKENPLPVSKVVFVFALTVFFLLTLAGGIFLATNSQKYNLRKRATAEETTNFLPAPTPQILFKDDFQSELNQWTIVAPLPGQVSIAPDPANPNQKALKIAYPDPAKKPRVTHNFSTPYSNVVLRAKFYDSLSPSMGTMLNVKDSAGNKTVLGVNTSNPKLNPNNYYFRYDIGSTIYEFDAKVSRSKGWHTFEFIILPSGTYGKIDGMLITDPYGPKNWYDQLPGNVIIRLNPKQTTVSQINMLSTWEQVGDSYYKEMELIAAPQSINQTILSLNNWFLKYYDQTDFTPNLTIDNLLPSSKHNNPITYLRTAIAEVFRYKTEGNLESLNKGRKMLMDLLSVLDNERWTQLEPWRALPVTTEQLISLSQLIWNELDERTRQEVINRVTAAAETYLPHQQIIFSENFESGLGQWQITHQSGESKISIVSSPDNANNHVLALDYKSTDVLRINHTFSSPLKEMVAKIKFYDNLSGTLGNMVNLRDPQTENKVALGANTGNAKLNPNNYYFRYDIGKNIYEFDSQIPRTKGWHTFEFVTASQGTFGKIDGQRATDKINPELKTISEINILATWGLIGQSYFDDVQVTIANERIPGNCYGKANVGWNYAGKPCEAGDTAAEDNSWTASFLAGAYNFLSAHSPTYPKFDQLEKKARCFAYHSITTSEDDRNGTNACSLDTQTVCDQNTPTVDTPNGAKSCQPFDLVNHGLVPHPNYMMATISALSEAAMYYKLFGKPVPRELTHNVVRLWNHYWNDIGVVDKNIYYYQKNVERFQGGFHMVSPIIMGFIESLIPGIFPESKQLEIYQKKYLLQYGTPLYYHKEDYVKEVLSNSDNYNNWVQEANIDRNYLWGFLEKQNLFR